EWFQKRISYIPRCGPLVPSGAVRTVHRQAGSSILRCSFWTPGMRVLVLSDLHANLTAFEAVLRAVSGRWDSSVCLGDVVGYGPDPEEVTSRLRALGATTIRGNHDKAAAHLMDTSDFNPVAKTAIDWTHEKIGADNLAWLSALPQGPLETD